MGIFGSIGKALGGPLIGGGGGPKISGPGGPAAGGGGVMRPPVGIVGGKGGGIDPGIQQTIQTKLGGLQGGKGLIGKVAGKALTQLGGAGQAGAVAPSQPRGFLKSRGFRGGRR